MNPTLTHSAVLLSTSYIPGTTIDPGYSDPNTEKERKTKKKKKREREREQVKFKHSSCFPSLL